MRLYADSELHAPLLRSVRALIPSGWLYATYPVSVVPGMRLLICGSVSIGTSLFPCALAADQMDVVLVPRSSILGRRQWRRGK